MFIHLYRGSFLLMLIFGFIHPVVSNSQVPDSVKNHIDTSIAVLKRHSLYADRVNWSKVEKEVYDSARHATTPAETFLALKIAFDALGDVHAAYYQYDDQYRLPNPQLTNRYSDSLKATWSKGPRIISRMIGPFAYISLPYIGANKQVDIDRFANQVYDAVAGLQQQQPSGWIVDLRLNAGGNIRPMLAGLAPLFDDGVVSYYIDRNGVASEEARFRNGDFEISGIKQANITKKIKKLAPVKVAVLVGAGTASSGEGVAAAFNHRKKTKLFGETTGGFANATDGFVFNNNNCYYLLSTAYLGNKKKKQLPEFVRPDVAIKSNDLFSNLEQDTVVQAAIKWLK